MSRLISALVSPGELLTQLCAPFEEVEMTWSLEEATFGNWLTAAPVNDPLPSDAGCTGSLPPLESPHQATAGAIQFWFRVVQLQDTKEEGREQAGRRDRGA